MTSLDAANAVVRFRADAFGAPQSGGLDAIMSRETTHVVVGL